MRAVNLMPVANGAARRSARGDTSYGVYVVLGGLAILVAFVALLTISNRQLDSSNDRLATVNAEAAAAEARAAAAAPYEQFAQLARDRAQTIASLSATRFDWAVGLREVSRVVPDNVWLVSIDGSSGSAPDAAVSPTSSAAPAPEFDMQGCTKSMSDVARLMARLRAVDGVRSVALTSSVKPDAGGNDQCPANRPSDPVFDLSISFAVPGSKKATVDSTGQIDASAPVGGSATPAASGAAAPAPAPAAASTPTTDSTPKAEVR